jgi:hypothetical protein
MHKKKTETMRSHFPHSKQVSKNTDITDVFPFGATAPIWAMDYLRETLRFASVY